MHVEPTYNMTQPRFIHYFLREKKKAIVTLQILLKGKRKRREKKAKQNTALDHQWLKIGLFFVFIVLKV